MTKHLHTIKANFDNKSIIMYQAFPKEIALPALKNNTFSHPFSFKRMTWIKPSYLWLMQRSNWGQKKNQEYILAIRMHRKFWKKVLKMGALTHPNMNVYDNYDEWQKMFEQAKVHIQWNPDRSIHGKPLLNYAIQAGLSRHIIE